RAAHFRLAEHFSQIANLKGERKAWRLRDLPLGDHVKKRLHLGGLDSGPHFRDDPGVRQDFVRVRIGTLDGPPVFVVTSRREGKVRRHDAHHGHRSFAEGNRSTYDGWIAAEMPLPKPMTDHQHVVFAWFTFLRGKRAS